MVRSIAISFSILLMGAKLALNSAPVVTEEERQATYTSLRNFHKPKNPTTWEQIKLFSYESRFLYEAAKYFSMKSLQTYTDCKTLPTIQENILEFENEVDARLGWVSNETYLSRSYFRNLIEKTEGLATLSDEEKEHLLQNTISSQEGTLVEIYLHLVAVKPKLSLKDFLQEELLLHYKPKPLTKTKKTDALKQIHHFDEDKEGYLRYTTALHDYYFQESNQKDPFA